MLHGETAVKRRQALIDQFQRDDGPPFMVLSLKAGGTGLNLTAASHVIHFDRWWNPAVENQATDRAFRIGQKRNVLVHKFVCRGTIEETHRRADRGETPTVGRPARRRRRKAADRNDQPGADPLRRSGRNASQRVKVVTLMGRPPPAND